MSNDKQGSDQDKAGSSGAPAKKMTLRLRNFKSIIVLHVYGTVGAREIAIVQAGAPKIEKKGIPLIIDFETCDFLQDALAAAEAFQDESLEKEKDYYFVSSVMSEPDAKTFAEALNVTENPNPDEILKCVELEKTLNDLEFKEEELTEQLGSDGSLNYESLKKQKEELEWTLKLFQEAVSRDGKLFKAAQATLNKDKDQLQQSWSTLDAQKEAALKLMGNKGVAV